MEGKNGADVEGRVLVEDLPMTFKVKYIGYEACRGLWGIKYTRRPVDKLVSVAKNLPQNEVLPYCDLIVSTEGVTIDVIAPKSTVNHWKYSIDTISYGVQDLVYTRVFAMIVVNDEKSANPYEAHAFVCESRPVARKLTFALAAAFQDYSRRVKENDSGSKIVASRQKFAIDLRTPEEIEEGIDEETEA